MKHALICGFLLLGSACSDSSDQTAATPASGEGVPQTAAVVPGPRTTKIDVGKMWLRDNYADVGEILYASSETDLNGDGMAEVVMYVGGPSMCGSGGCGVIVLQLVGEDLVKVGDLSVSRLPIGVLESTTNGWHDLTVTTYGGGAPESIKRVPFDGTNYASNPTVPPAEPVSDAGTILIPDAPLTPLD